MLIPWELRKSCAEVVIPSAVRIFWTASVIVDTAVIDAVAALPFASVIRPAILASFMTAFVCELSICSICLP